MLKKIIQTNNFTNTSTLSEEAERARAVYILAQKQAIYDAIATLLPVEGRDYTLQFIPEINGDLKISMTGITEIGDAFAKYCLKNFENKLKEIQKDKMKFFEKSQINKGT